jgi:hypothetical protein
MRWTTTLFILAALCLLAGQPGCSGQTPPLSAGDELLLSTALAQLDDLPEPDGVDALHFAGLRTELRTELQASGVTRWISSAPTDEANRVLDLQLARIDDFSALASWSYRNVGDYDQNSQVNISDLTPLGVNLGQSSTAAGWETAEPADGDANGQITISDITPLGVHLQNSVDGYFVQFSLEPEVESSWQLVSVSLFTDSSLPAGGGRRSFSVTLPAVSGQFFRVVPFSDLASGIAGTPFAYTGQTGGGLSYDERREIMDQITEKLNNLTATTSNGQDAEITSFLLTLPHIEAAGFDEGNPWGRYDDGLEFMICKNFEPPGAAVSSPRDTSDVSQASVGSGPPALSSSADSAMSRRLRQGSATGVPAGDLADLYHSFGTGNFYTNPVSDIAGILEDHGYMPFARDATVDSIKVHNGGVFFIEAHGGTTRGRDDVRQYFISLSEPVTREAEARYYADLYASPARLAHVEALNGQGEWEWTYGFSGAFVEEYMGFSEESVVMLNACRSGNAVAAAMVQGFHSVGAGVVLGWTRNMPNEVVDAGAKHFFDRSMGANQLSRQESPPIRPFNYFEILGDMALRGVSAGQILQYPVRPPAAFAFGFLTYSIKGGGETPNFLFLAPTIAHLAVDESKNQLQIEGDFGDVPGIVTVGGTSVETIWDIHVLLCTLPSEGPGSSGDVIVEVRGHKSNVRRLTEWHGGIIYESSGPGTLHRSATFVMHLRGDVDDWRNAPADDPLLSGDSGTGFVSFSSALDGLATVNSGGSNYDPVPDCATTWSNGSQTIIPTSYEPLQLGEPRWYSIAFYDVAQRIFGFTGFAITAPYHSHIQCGPSIDDQDTFFTADLSAVVQIGLGKALEIPLNADYTVSEGALPEITAGEVTYSISWTDWTVASTPDPNAAK